PRLCIATPPFAPKYSGEKSNTKGLISPCIPNPKRLYLEHSKGASPTVESERSASVRIPRTEEFHMHSVPNARSHRKAFGAHRPMSPAVKARNVACSIAQRTAEGRSWTFADYGIEANPTQQAMVLAALREGAAS